MEFYLFVFTILSFAPLYTVNSNDTSKQFAEFIQKFNKTYRAGHDEYSSRYMIFKENLRKQKKLNSFRQRIHKDSAWYGPTQFSDLTEKEFAERYLSSYKSQNISKSAEHFWESHASNTSPYFSSLMQIPKKVDWREKKIVTSVKNQGRCGGCWAFSTVATIESMHAKSTGILESLSTQEVLDCSYAYNVLHGCRGGDTCTALNWLVNRSISLVPEKVYPTVDKPEQCKFSSITKAGVHVKNYTCLSYVNKENLLLQVLANIGPVAVSVDATSWMNYQGGIIQYHCGEAPNNHAVEIVGYDLTGEVPYYIIKNSWGEAFGIHGYVYIMVGRNVCGLVQEVSTVETT